MADASGDIAAVRRASPAAEQAWIVSTLQSEIARPAIRVWLYDSPAVILGRSRRADPAIEQRARQAGLALLERLTGGGAVLAGSWMIGATVILPPAHPRVEASIPGSFRWFGLAHAAWLDGAGIRVRTEASPVRARQDPLSWACFAGLSHWEATVDDRKVVGLAQARRRHGIVYASGTLIGHCPWQMLAAVLGAPEGDAQQLARRTASCAEILESPPSAEVLADGLLEALASACLS